MASSGDKVAIESLDVDNYDTWCVRMKLLLIQKKLWKVIEDPTATAEQSQGALALIGLHVSPFGEGGKSQDSQGAVG
jgi:hypothetical protein